MGLRINQNIAAQNAYRNLSVTDSQMSKSLEKLSSGFRINRAADDAAGLSISEGLRAQTGGLKVAVRNAQDGISVVQTAEGALNEVTSMLQRMRDLSVQASSSGGMDPKALEAAQQEFAELNTEIDRIGNTTSFGKSKLLNGSFGSTMTTGPSAAPVTALPATAIAGAGGTPWTFELSQVDGDDLTGSEITVSVESLAADATAADLTKAVNDALKTALKANGYKGSEVSMSSTVGSAGATFSMNGVGEFAVTDGAGAELATGLGLTLTGDTAVANGNTGQFQVGANADDNDSIGISINAVNSGTLATGVLDLEKVGGAKEAITAIDKAISAVSGQRATLGAYQNRFEHTINNLNVAVENLSASESRIRDTDMAQEMVGFTRNQILTQAGTAMLAQANQASQNVLSLLR